MNKRLRGEERGAWDEHGACVGVIRQEKVHEFCVCERGGGFFLRV